jgi:hypothetical protein
LHYNAIPAAYALLFGLDAFALCGALGVQRVAAVEGVGVTGSRRLRHPEPS